jgi:hypothetical protein
MNVNAQFPGSARVSRAGGCVLAPANFPLKLTSGELVMHNERLFRRDTETNTRDACATRRPTLHPQEVVENR